jgi:S-DNA-T family DNA segregation ATPase FtsK/SpoIIIE
VFVVVDGWADLRADHAELEPVLHRVASRGLALGVHLVVAAGRWGDLRAATRDLFGTRVELRLGDPLDSEVDRRMARLVPADRPGRGLSADGHHLLTALPRLDGDADPTTAAAGLADLVDRVAAAWPEPPAPRLGRLPTEVRLDDLRSLAGEGDHLLLGADDRQAIGLDPRSEPLLLVLGDRGSGRTTALRTLTAEVVRTRGPTRAQLVVIDPRRGLLGAVPPDHLLGHHVSAATAEPALHELADHLRGRLPGPGPDAMQWSGAEVHLVVDDHELLAAAGRSPLTPLLPLLPHAADIGLRVAVSRRTAGAARALHEPDLRALRELDVPTLLLPGSPDEGPLVGRLAARPGPPGRGRLVTAGGEVTELQVARVAAEEGDP